MRVDGIHRGRVTQNVDPTREGRVQVSVPSVLGEGTLAWAMPCAPLAGNGVGLVLVPPVEANVWVAFEGGDLDYPIVLGGFWGSGESPSPTGLPTTAVLKLDGVTITVDTLPGAGGLTVEVGPPAVTVPVTLSATSSGLELGVGASTIALNGVSVSVNGGALEVM